MMSTKPSFLDPYRDLLRNVVWLSVASAAVKPLWLFFIVVLCARVLGAEGYGVLNTALSVGTLAFAVTNFGIAQYTVREVSGDRSLAPRFFSNFVVIRLVMVVPTAAVALGAGVALGYDRELLFAVGFACLYFAAQSLKQYGHSLFQAFENLRFQALSVVAEKVLVILAGGALLYTLASPTSVLSAMAVGMVLTTGLTVWWVIRYIAPFRWAELDAAFVRRSLRRLVPFGLAGLFGMMYFRVDTVIVEAMLGTTAAGQYGLAFRIVEALNMLPLIVVHATLYPRLSSLSADRDYDEFQKIAGLGGGMLAAASIPVALVLTLFGSLLIGWISSDPELAPASLALQILCWAFPLTCLRNLGYVALLALHDQRFIAGALGAGVGFNITLNLALIPSHGIYGAAIATICSEVLLLAVYATRYRGLKARVSEAVSPPASSSPTA
jgi:O-antigen/teichoic acid export membrane protein